MTYSIAERESIGLCIAFEAINDLVNHVILELREVSAYPGEYEVYFQSFVHQQLFLVRLLDFVHESGDKSLTGVQGSCLVVLQNVCKTRSFDVGGSIEPLEFAVNELTKWLNHKTQFRLWLPTLNLEADLYIPRLEFLRISGNQSKHNISRLTRVSEKISEALKGHGYAVPPEDIPLALDDFRGHLEENYFVYYGTWVAELLNNLRWGIYEYLQPTFQSSYRKKPDHKIEYPAGIDSATPKGWFCRLMNHVSNQPHVQRFDGAHYMKKDAIG